MYPFRVEDIFILFIQPDNIFLLAWRKSGRSPIFVSPGGKRLASDARCGCGKISAGVMHYTGGNY
jgi:hypothetical protein